eukprot:gene4532-6398_t
MKRSTQLGFIYSFIVISYILVRIWTDYVSFPTDDYDFLQWIIHIIPWYSLMIFGSYCLGKLGYDLMVFNDYPDEIKKLELDIIRAKQDLLTRGFKVN